MHSGPQRLLAALLLPVVLGALACGDECPVPVPDPPAPAAGTDVLAQLQAIPGVQTVAEATSRYPETYRLFVLELEQPVDHCETNGETFTQTATLLFRDAAAPVVFRTAGYWITRNPTLSEPAQLLGANQLSLEHRYYGSSYPEAVVNEPYDWTKLTVFQAASDHHWIRQALRKVLPGKWLNTGHSKDGMSAVFQRYFYPDDVTATAAYVAPLMFSQTDERFVTFLENVGEASCREALKTYQRTLLSRKEEVKPEFTTWGQANGRTFDLMTLDRIYDYATLESSFAFWQYGDASMCATIPGPDAAPAELFQLLVDSGVIGFMHDAALGWYQGFFYQSAVELGAPAYPQAHLLDLTGGVAIDDLPVNYPPFGVDKPYDPKLMQDVDAWVKASAPTTLLVYGGNDPWSAGMMTPAAGADSHRYVVAGGNHGARIAGLPENERLEIYGHLERWMGATVTPPVGPIKLPAHAPAAEHGERPRL